MTRTIRSRALGALLLTLPLALAACGGGAANPEEATNAGYAALGSGDAEAAVDHFSQALAQLKPGDKGYKRARMGEVEAKARVAPDAAAASFLDYAKSSPDQVEAGDYRKVGVQLSERKAYTAAGNVLDAGIQRFPDDAPLREAMDLTIAKAQQSGDTSALDALKGLGYVGGD